MIRGGNAPATRLSLAEDHALVIQARTDPEARAELLRRNQGLVYREVNRHKHFDQQADLIQEGNIGLLEAIDRFDFEKGVRFATYAMFWIRHFVQRAVGKIAAREAEGRFEEPHELPEPEPPPEPTDEQRAAVLEHLPRLKPRVREVMELLLGGATRNQVAKQLGISPERVRQLRDQGIAHLQKLMKGATVKKSTKPIGGV